MPRDRGFGVEAYAWLRYMEFPYLGPGLLVKWERPPSLHNIIDPAVVRDVTIHTPSSRKRGVLVVSEVPRSLHGVALPLPREGPGLYRVGLSVELGVYTRAVLRGYGGTVEVCVYGGRREAESLGMKPLASTLIRGYATTHLVVDMPEKTTVTEPEPLGMPVEIVPLHVSNVFSPGEPLEVQVIAHGSPVSRARLQVAHIDGSSETVEANEDGIAVVRVGPAVTVVSYEHVEERGDEEYDHVKETATLSIQALTI